MRYDGPGNVIAWALAALLIIVLIVVILRVV